MEYRECTITSLLGPLVYLRAYYHCDQCHHGYFPTDEEFGLNRKPKLTLGAREVIAQAGVLEPFEEAALRILPRLCGLRVSPSTVQRATEDVGTDISQRREAGETFGPRKPWDWHQDSQGAQVAYVSLDATSVPQQGPAAEKAEGRMPWVGAVFNPWPKGQPRSQRIWDARYVSGLNSLEGIGDQLRRECEAVGVGKADIAIGLTDGGNGLENCLMNVLGGLAPRMVFILDFYHAAEHLREFAKTWIADEARREKQMDAWCHQLKHQGGRALLDELAGLSLSKASRTTREAYRELVGYFRNNLHRMDYPDYVACGWQIGSGMIEAACKTVVGQRLKLSGMRWREPGTDALCQLRALYKSERHLWPAYWNRSTPVAAA